MKPADYIPLWRVLSGVGELPTIWTKQEKDEALVVYKEMKAKLAALEADNAEWRSLVGRIIRNEISREEFIEGYRSLELMSALTPDSGKEAE